MIIAFLMMNPFHHKFRVGMPTEDMGGEFNGYVAFDVIYHYPIRVVKAGMTMML